MSTRGFGFSKIHTSLLYLTGNYMEMWHNGEQASGVTTANGGDKAEGHGAMSEGFSSRLNPRTSSSLHRTEMLVLAEEF